METALFLNERQNKISKKVNQQRQRQTVIDTIINCSSLIISQRHCCVLFVLSLWPSSLRHLHTHTLLYKRAPCVCSCVSWDIFSALLFHCGARCLSPTLVAARLEPKAPAKIDFLLCVCVCVCFSLSFFHSGRLTSERKWKRDPSLSKERERESFTISQHQHHHQKQCHSLSFSFFPCEFNCQYLLINNARLQLRRRERERETERLRQGFSSIVLCAGMQASLHTQSLL